MFANKIPNILQYHIAVLRYVTPAVDKPVEIMVIDGEKWFSKEKLEMLRALLNAGWNMEVVMRGPGSSGRKAGDVYYYSPQGKKLRTSKQVERYLFESNFPFTNFLRSQDRWI